MKHAALVADCDFMIEKNTIIGWIIALFQDSKREEASFDSMDSYSFSD